VADVFEALTADRHYRKGMSPAQAISILREGVGTRFDANVLTALEQTLESGDAAEVGLAGARAG
jgi:HD-GYP domain-containing protein (c-di-GMP phosphodiesterase class II)